jgi:hypothetical protein
MVEVLTISLKKFQHRWPILFQIQQMCSKKPIQTNRGKNSWFQRQWKEVRMTLGDIVGIEHYCGDNEGHQATLGNGRGCWVTLWKH